MADATIFQPAASKPLLPIFVKRARKTIGQEPQAGRINRFGHFLSDVATSKKTHDFVMGAVLSGATSFAVRSGVIAAAATVGTAAIPTAIIAASAAGAATGAVRYYLDYKKEKAAGTWQGFDKAAFFKKMLVSTAFSTAGGGMTYVVMNHGDAIMNSGAVNTVKSYAAAAINWVSPGTIDTISAESKAAVANIRAAAVALAGVEWSAKLDSSVQSVKQMFKGFGAMFKSIPAIQAQPKIVIADLKVLPPITSEQIVAEMKPTVPVQMAAPEIDKSVAILPAPITTEVLPAIDTTVPVAVKPAAAAELKFHFASTGELPAAPQTPLSYGAAYAMPENMDVTEGVFAVVPQSMTFTEEFSGTFEGMDLSARAERAVEKAMSGDLQAQKDLAMKIFNGQGGFSKDPALALKLYDNVIANGLVEGEKPTGAVFQAMRDRAYIEFHGLAGAADPEAARATMGELAKFNAGARDMLAEWNGEKVHHAATSASKAVSKGAAAASGGLNCEFVTAGKKVLMGTCDITGTTLKVGDIVTLTP